MMSSSFGTLAALLCIVHQSTSNILILPHGGTFIEEVFRDEAANFGAEIPYDDLRGNLFVSKPINGCSSITPAPTPSTTYYFDKSIVIMARNDCPFEQKVRNAQAAGYKGVIVHNINSDELQVMNAKNGSGILIPAVFVGETAGLIMRRKYAKPGYYLIINREEPFNINMNLLLPFAIVVGVCFIVMIIFMVVKCIKDRRRQRRYRLPSSTLNKIPIHKFVKGDPYDCCAICLEDYVENEKLRVLPCAHAYHSSCIDPWLTKNRRVCPVCKRKVFAHDEVPSDLDSDSDADDRTPLVNPANRGTQGGTFDAPSENVLQRAARSISQQMSDDVQFVTASGYHSINTEHTDGVSTDESNDFTIPPGPSQYRNDLCFIDEAHTHTRPSTSSEDKQDVIV